MIRKFLADLADLNKLREVRILANTRGSTKGLIKRIDENRELLQLLQTDAPEFLADHPWVTNWIAINDTFLNRLAEIMETPLPTNRPDYPRPWPAASDD